MKVSAESAEPYVPRDASLAQLRDAVQGCRGCELYRDAIQAVFGEGPAKSPMMLVGEQPGDREDREGKPFVGPAGGILDQALQDARIDRGTVYVTNAVKHFKHHLVGKRRIHDKPSARDLAACRPWLDAEVERIRPRLIVCLGATAAKAVFGNDYRVTKPHGTFTPHRWDGEGTSTLHPSVVLRARDEDRERMYRQIVEDLEKARQRMDRLT